MNYFQNPNIGINVSRNCANSLVREIEFLGLPFELLPQDVAQFLVSYYCKSNTTLEQCFSTAGSRPSTGPWHQLYRAARGLRKLQYATKFH